MSSTVLDMSFGRINLAAESLTLSAWMVEEGFKKQSAVTAGRRQKGTQRFLAATTHVATGKGFTSDQVTHDDGTIILLEARGTRNGLRRNEAGLFLRVRHDGPLVMVQAKLPTSSVSILGNRLSVFQGRADVLTVDEAYEYVPDLPNHYVRDFMDAEDIATAFIVTKVKPEVRARPNLEAVVTSDGKTELVEVSAPIQRTVRRTIRRTA